MWCQYLHDHCHENRITICSSINRPTVICLSRVCLFSWQMPLGKAMAPGSIHNILLKTPTPFCHLFTFILFCILQLSTHLICLQITRSRGLTTLLPALGASCLSLYVESLKTVEDWYSYWFDKPWFITEGNTYLHYATITRSSSWKTQRRSQSSILQCNLKYV